MEVFAIIFGTVIILIVWAIIASKMTKRRIDHALKAMAPELPDHIRAQRKYNILLSHGQRLQGATFLGVTRSPDPNNAWLPFPLNRWLVIEKPDGVKAFIKPETVRYYEEAE